MVAAIENVHIFIKSLFQNKTKNEESENKILLNPIQKISKINTLNNQTSNTPKLNKENIKNTPVKR